MTPPTAPTQIGHQMILASAGSGKTYTLTNRFVHLLALGVPPHRILALTFTRKAAAEFLDEILRKLAGAATDPSQALALRDGLAMPAFNGSTATSLLRLLVSELHLLTLGTLDSFFNRILTCFPAEFGLSSSFEIMETHEAAQARLSVFQDLFRNDSLHPPLIAAFKASTFGHEEKSLIPLLHDFISAHHTLYLQAPRHSQWGHPSQIWPSRDCPWLHPHPHPEEHSRALSAALVSLGLDKIASGMWEGFLREVPALHPGHPRPAAISETFLDRLLTVYPEIRAGGPVEIKCGRKTYLLDQHICLHLAPLLDHLLACELIPHLHRTRGIFDLLQTFESRYHDAIRRSGKLGFEDVQLLLSGLLHSAGSQAHLSLDGAGGRLNIDYRLDGQFDHWLLDEFQDTSLPQWKVIENLVDEVIQDSSSDRSFFYVGDVKQAIFGWRGGDSHLFQDIYEHYHQGGRPQIGKDTMELSWRSGPHLLHALNRVFGELTLLRRLFPDHRDAVDRWIHDWRPHHSAHPDRADFVRLLTLPKGDSGGPSKQERRQAAVAALLQEFRLRERRLSCAILVRANKSAHALASYLRAHTDIEVMVDGDTQIGRDHPLGASFLALLQLAAHPGDTLAWKHLCMTPALHRDPSLQSSSSRRRLVAFVLDLLHASGFRAVFDHWVHLLSLGGFTPDPFARRRIELLRQASREFDQGGNRSIPDFLRFAEALSSRESHSEGVVQILTIHKSKGLGFDAVIVAEIEGERERSLSALGNTSLLVHEQGRGLRREIDWILSMPRKDLCQLDPTLLSARRHLENEGLYEELCLLYVALTRAKFATYILCGEPGNASSSAPALLARALQSTDESPPPPEWPCGADVLHIAYESGNPLWFDEERFLKLPDPSASTLPPPPSTVAAARPFPSLPRSRPSTPAGDSSPQLFPGDLFLPGSTQAADFGTRVHALFEKLEWIDDLSPPSLHELLIPSLPPPSPADRLAAEAVLHALEIPDIAAAFHCAAFGEKARVWREQNFEMVLQGSWVSGTFDRVVLTSTRAWIYDFKTNRVTTPEDITAACDSYATQLATYRSALALLLRLPVSAITSHLIFTYPRIIRQVPLPA